MSKETVLTNLKKLPQPYKSLALQNYLNRTRGPIHLKRNTHYSDSISGALNGAFNWMVSPQGHSFWSSIYEQLAENDEDITTVKWPKITRRHQK